MRYLLLFPFFIGCYLLWIAMRQELIINKRNLWGATTGVVIKTGILEKRDREGNSYQLDIEYKYEVDGKEYRSSSIAPMLQYLFLPKSLILKKLKKYSLHQEIEVSFKIKDKAVSYIELNNTAAIHIFYILGVIFIFVSVCIFLISIFLTRLAN